MRLDFNNVISAAGLAACGQKPVLGAWQSGFFSLSNGVALKSREKVHQKSKRKRKVPHFTTAAAIGGLQ